MPAASRSHRFKAADVELAGQRVDGDLYSVRLPTGTGWVFACDRTIAAFGDRLGAAFIARRLNAFVARVGIAEAVGCLRRRHEPIQLAPDGTIDEA